MATSTKKIKFCNDPNEDDEVSNKYEYSDRKKYVSFTINEWLPIDLEKLKTCTAFAITYWVVGEEIGENYRKPLLRGYMMLEKMTAFALIKSYMGPRFNFRRTHAVPLKNKKYCCKGSMTKIDYDIYGNEASRGYGKDAVIHEWRQKKPNDPPSRWVMHEIVYRVHPA